MNNPFDAPPLKSHQAYWPPPVSTTASAPAQMVVEDIIDTYAAMTHEPGGSQVAGSTDAVPRPGRKRKNEVQRTPSPVPGLQIPDYRRRKVARSAPQMTPPSPSPVPAPMPAQPEPLPTQFVQPYYVANAPAVPEVAYSLVDMPPPQAQPMSESMYVPLPRHGFIHELPQMLPPHTFTPMFTSPNGRFKYYVFADDDGAAKVALIGRVDEMQVLYQDLACHQPGLVAPLFAAAPPH